MANHYDIPSWAGKPPTGLHLDVLKGDRLVQKLMLDQKKCYLFGRNQEMCDFSIDHQSCSRVHAAFVYHKFLEKGFLVDLGSTHGTFIGNLKIESHKPTLLPIDSQFHFGHSTRVYVLRARPQIPNIPIMEEFENEDDNIDSDNLKLENELALDNITEYNTAQNRRITLIGITDRSDFSRSDLKRKKHSVTFNDEEEVINPEDIDPTIGRFRNLIHTTVIPAKRPRQYIEDNDTYQQKVKENSSKGHFPSNYHNDLYYDIPGLHFNEDDSGVSKIEDGFSSYSSTIVAKLGLPLPNPAPDVDLIEKYEVIPENVPIPRVDMEPKKKKYAKEAWPGKKPSGPSIT
ncbi:hypothetical protein PGB90_002247 [Kerria lacca]